jgi:tRNA threonylcarbamoyladenosine biosynthesis protein TsaB
MTATHADPPARPAPLLVIDTSSGQGGIALYDGETLSARSWPAERSHTATLLPEIHHLLAAAGCEIERLAAVGVAIGPGAFTGLRVGLGVAKGFHLATGVPLLGLSTLEAAALPFAACGQVIVAAVAAGRGRLVWARYAPTADGLAETDPPRNGLAAELAASLAEAGPAIVTGELDATQERLLAAIPGVVVPPAPLRIRQPGALAALAWRRWQVGETDDAVAVEPVYLSR